MQYSPTPNQFGQIKPPEEQRRELLASINAGRDEHYISAVRALYNVATKLSDRVDVEDLTDARVSMDVSLMGITHSYMQYWPMRVESIVSITSLQARGLTNVRKAIRDINLDHEMSLLTDSELKDLAWKGIFEEFGDRPMPVVPVHIAHKPRSKWPYLRLIRHMQPQDLQASITNRKSVERTVIKAQDELAVLDRLARRVNPAMYSKNASMEDILT